MRSGQEYLDGFVVEQAVDCFVVHVIFSLIHDLADSDSVVENVCISMESDVEERGTVVHQL